MMNDEILNLKAEGKSLREIASILGISHEAVRKRLKRSNEKDGVSTIETDQKLTASTNGDNEVSTCSKLCKSRVSEKSEGTVNQVSTKKTPSLTLSRCVNPIKTLSINATESRKGVFQEVSSGIDDLLGSIRGFLESKGIELYQIRVEPEAYQVKHNGQVIRFYILRKNGGSQVPRDGLEVGK